MPSGIDALLDQAIAGEHRSSANRLRDPYRHPRETLLFFGLRPEMTVVEIWPGGGWYSEIIGPVLRERGRYYLAQYAVENPQAPGWQREARARQETRVAEQPGIYGKPVFTAFGPPGHLAIAPADSADLVLTFRNVHNWSNQKSDEAAFQAFFTALKPGGILGVVEHRAKPGTPFERMIKTGYMTEAYVIGLAEKAGFRLVEKSAINANPLDTTDHPNGVWTLPPVMRGRLAPEKYAAIGESDRMTLKFRKPE
ncbi:MAG: methyltransferase [Burkholderiales bacterium]|nr:methyltransferase [Burkholderiales bacterium]